MCVSVYVRVCACVRAWGRGLKVAFRPRNQTLNFSMPIDPHWELKRLVGNVCVCVGGKYSRGGGVGKPAEGLGGALCVCTDRSPEDRDRCLDRQADQVGR